MKVSDYMTKDVVTANLRDGLRQTHERMHERLIRHMPVLGDDGKLAGIITDRDIRRPDFVDTNPDKVDVYAIDDDGDYELQGGPDSADFELMATVVRGGVEVQVLERNALAPDATWIDVEYRFVWPDGRTLDDRMRHHFLPWPVLATLLFEAGFTDLAVAGDFDGARFDEASEIAVVSAR